MLCVIRKIAGIVAISLLVSSAVPLFAEATDHGMACCPKTPPACPERPTLRCCAMSAPAPATPAAPTVSAPASQRAEIAVLASAATLDVADLALEASRRFVARQGSILHAPSHLRLHVLLI